MYIHCKYNLKRNVSLGGILCILVVLIAVSLSQIVNTVESLCTPAQVKAEYKALTEQPAFNIAKGASAFNFLNADGSCALAHKAALVDKTPLTLNDFSSTCNISPLDPAWKNDPCCGNSGNQCCARRSTIINLFEVNMGNLTCAQDVRVEASLAFFPSELRVGLCDASSIQANIDSEIAIIKSSGCDKSKNPEAFVDCLNTQGMYGPLALPSLAAVFGLLSNASKEEIVPFVISNNIMIRNCYNHQSKANDANVTQQVCEGSTTVCPFADNCVGSQSCFYCDNRLNCTVVSLDSNGVAFNDTTCSSSVMCGKGNSVMNKVDCDNLYECDLNCPGCNSTQCTSSGYCEGYPVKGVICAVQAVSMSCPVGCSHDHLMDLCLCQDSSLSLADHFNVTNPSNNVSAPPNAVPNTVCRVGYWELVPPTTPEVCHSLKGCFNPQTGSFNALSTCKNKQCANSVIVESVYKFKYGKWGQAIQKSLNWNTTQTISPREWVWTLNTDSHVSDKVYTNMVSLMKPDLVAKKMSCLTNFEEKVVTFAACKCGSAGNDPACTDQNYLTFVDAHLVVPPGSDNKALSESLSFGHVSVPPQSSFNSAQFVEVRSTFKTPQIPLMVKNSTASTVGVVLGHGYTFNQNMSGVTLCLSKLPSPSNDPLNAVGFARDTGYGPVELKIPTTTDGISVCAVLTIDNFVTYYAMKYEMPPPPNYNGNGTYYQPPVCFGILGNNSNVCSSHGSCMGPDYCSCHHPFYGPKCELTNNGNGTYNQPPVCFGILGNNSNVCSSHGNCLGPDYCSCHHPFYGQRCEFSNNGTYNNNGSYNQQIPICYGILGNNSNVCSSHGSCKGPDYCLCNPPFYGPKCELTNNGNGTYYQPPVCYGILGNNSNVCSSHGNCLGPDYCSCHYPFYGQRCELTNNGTYNNNGVPICFGMLGNNSNVCYGRGKCIANDVCQCNPPFYGKSCEINSQFNTTTFSCKGISASSPSVCSGGGACIANEVCRCNSSRFGVNCENFACYSKSVGSCSGNGVCVGPDLCSCKMGWAGPECNICAKGYAGPTCSLLVCFGLDQTSKFVCSGNGACVGVDKCACRTGSSGQKCEQFTCGGSNEHPPCMNHGTCVGPNTCICNSTQATGFWTGSNCESCQPNFGGSDCKSMACNPSVTCLGRGTCNSDTTCTCSGNFVGPFCRTCIDSFFGPYCNVTCDPFKKCNGNGYCVAGNGACNCFSNSLMGMFTGETCNTCASGWSGAKCNIKLGSSATFGSVGDRISFEYAFPSLTNNIDCATILSVSSLNAIGLSPICRWDDRSKNSFQIILGAAASLLPGDSLQVKNSDNSYGVITTSGSSSTFLPPTAQLRGPKNVSSCTTFFFDASASISIDRRPLKFSYSISGPGSLTNLNNLLASVSGSYGFIDASLLTNGEFTMTSTVTNAFNLTAISSFTFTVSSTPSVIVRIPGGPSQSLNMGTLFSILPIVEYPSCFFSDRTLIWTWTQESGPATATMTLRNYNRALIFLENAFPSAGTYSFKVKAVAQASPSSVYETVVTLEVVATDLVLMITGGTTRKASVANAFSIDFSRSFDPSRSSSSDSFSATCTDLLTNSACSYSMSNVISNKVATFPANSLPEGEYSIVITYTKGSRSSSQEVYVSMVGYAVLSASIRLVRNDWIPSAVPLGENIPLVVDIPYTNSLVNFTWSSLTEGFTLSEGSTTAFKTTGRSLIILGKSLSADVTYSIRVDVSTQDSAGYSVFAFTVNSPPLPGSISANPQTSTAGVDTVTIACNGWYDTNSPLTYQFFFYDLTRGVWNTLSARTTDNQIQAKLPPSPASDRSLKIRARVFDSKGAVSVIETSVVSAPPDLSSGTAALNFLNQSANVADSTANSASALSSLSSISSQTLSTEVVNQVKTFLVNVITSVLAKQSQVAVSVEDAAETISFISAATGNLDLVDSNTRGQMLQSTAASLLALSNSDKPISSDVAKSITSSLSNFIKNVLASAGITSRRSIQTAASDAQSILDSAESLLSSMSRSQVLDQSASISASSEFTIYTKKISTSSSASFGEVVSNNTAFQLPANFASGFSSSVTSVGISIKQLSNLYKTIYSQSMNVVSKVFELRLENADSGAKLSLDGQVRVQIVLSGNFTLSSLPSKYDCLLWNNSTKVFSKDSTCTISSVSSSSATLSVAQGGTYAVSQAVTAVASTPITPVASKSTTNPVTPKPSKSKKNASSTNFVALLAIVISVVVSMFVTM